MARLCAENKAPDQKGQRMFSRFTDFFNGSHSRTSLSSSHTTSLPAASPLGGVGNLKPRFEKVGLHPSERSHVYDIMESSPSETYRVLHLEEWGKLMEENKKSGHLAKMDLYKEREELKQCEEGKEEQVTESPPSVKSRNNSMKAMKVLRIESGPGEKKGSDTTVITADFRDSLTVKFVKSLFQNEEKDSSQVTTSAPLAEALGNEYEGSIPSSIDSLRAVANPTPSRHPSLRHSPPLDDLHTSAQSQVPPIDPILNIRDVSDNDSISVNDLVIPHERAADAIDLQKYRFSRFYAVDSKTSSIHTHMAKNGLSSIKQSPVTKTSKLGPLEVEYSTARALTGSLLPLTYTVLLFAKAIQGLYEFFGAVWKVLVLAIDYTGLRRLMCWNEADSSDVLLVPLEEYGCKMKQCCTQIMGTFMGAFAQALVEALRELDAEDGI